MTPRLNPSPWIDLGKTFHTDGLEPLLKELVSARASQINGCSFCIHHHTSDARKYGEHERSDHA
jgi:AhpD family alkylhydroperoxidase